ncbi:CBS domain-containing protein (plasmid) [Burkholderia thailandensis]|uniref:CBS domain-containing protein n=1 Tax=Burkholderia thailandensis TaxID=57975 RepID=UPI00192D9DE8|nr:CBS domain-containing protein [Burkholderia thailandensis]MBS2132190.1 CBS domain-containing protein [Burkholderia thailandensis]QRA15286.1 CBS domain-containing protein [Burkholderia thailandensis]
MSALRTLNPIAASKARGDGHENGRCRDTTCLTVDEKTPLEEVAHLLEIRHIRRVPRLRGDRIVGVVCRADLALALAIASLEPNPQQVVSNREIRAMLMGKIASPSWVFSRRNVIAHTGFVHLLGYYVWSPEQVKAMRVAAEGIPSVRAG